VGLQGALRLIDDETPVFSAPASFLFGGDHFNVPIGQEFGGWIELNEGALRKSAQVVTQERAVFIGRYSHLFDLLY
jgi:hypothetical protein